MTKSGNYSDLSDRAICVEKRIGHLSDVVILNDRLAGVQVYREEQSKRSKNRI